ncbi:UNVERIFIED_CONTAM: hypothetical protein FKN15_037638 [Acipenser sinensis]
MQVVLLCASVLCWGQVYSALRKQEQTADKGREERGPRTQTAAPRTGAHSERGKMQGGEDRTKSPPPKRNMRRKPERNTKTQPPAAPKLETSKRNQSARPRFRKQEESALKRKEVGIRRQEMGFSSREVMAGNMTHKIY